ncbi:MAG: nucleotide sugar dehydrogenase [Alphaproteobacteria bacterium HGW-Alphaproteobacteria-6]|nr:MAG: nucleotide sugar dehydrogenase [Alphaproteobacteria bacterium HGW-Alphaproteobacteria-6]
MKVAIFGLGYVGFTAACCIASQGHEVVGVDVSDAKIADVNAGRPPFEEPGLAEMMAAQLAAGRLSATSSVADAIAGATVAVVCVGTPSGIDGAHDMRYIVDVSRQIASALAGGGAAGPRLTVAYRSTMRPGSIRKLIAPIFRAQIGEGWQARAELVYNPEFLREAQAIQDYFQPSKIVVGTVDGQPCAAMEALHEGIEAPVFVTGYEEAELTKFVDNSWHAVKVAFANEIGRVCERLDVSARMIHQIFVADTKLNISPYYTRPGGAFGGSCLPKDVRALQHIATDAGANAHLIDSLLRSNEAHKNHQFQQIVAGLAPGARVLIAGLAFKAGTDDLRESPNVDIARKLIEAGFAVSIFDPGLQPAKLRGQNLGYAYTHLPSIDTLLVDQAVAQAGPWDLVVASNATARLLDLTGRRVIETHTIR